MNLQHTWQRYFGATRGSRVRLSVLTGLIAKGSFIIASLLLTPLLIRYLGNQGYGLFITVTAVVAWLQVTNFGVGAGLQNALTEAVTRGDLRWQRELVSTAFVFLLGVTGLLAVAATGALVLVPWHAVFAVTHTEYSTQVMSVVGVVLGGFVSTSLLSFTGSIYAARQELHISNIVAIANAVILVLATLFVIHLDLGLLGITLANVGTTVVVSWAFALGYLARKSSKVFRPSVAFVSRAAWKRLFSSSAAFFVLQLCCVALFQSDYFIIAQCLNVDEVTPYSVAAKPFSVLAAVFAAAVSQPLWAGYGNAKASGDIAWIRRNHAKVRWVVMGVFAAGFVFMLAVGRPLLVWWVGESAAPSLALIAATGAYFLVRQWTDLHAILVNGLDMMKPQAYSATIHAAVTITLQVVLARTLGIIGIPIALFTGYVLVSAWFLPLIASRSLRRLDGERSAAAEVIPATLQRLSP